MRLVDKATERPVTVLMFFIAVALFGAVSLSRLDVNLLPDLSYPTLTVRTELTGAAPQEIESLLSKPIEEAVGIIKNVRQVRSVSRSGQSDVVIEFLWGTDMNLASVDVREKLDIVTLPLEAKRPLLLRFDPSGEPVMRLALRERAGESEAAPALGEDALKSLRRLAEDELKDDLESVQGVAAVKVSGGLEDEIQVLVDQRKLAQLGLSVGDVAARLRAENVNLSGGRLEEGTRRYLVRTVNEFDSVRAMANAVIAAGDARPVYLRDIAEVRRGYKERKAITRVDGVEAVELAVYKEGDANTVQVARGVVDRLERVRETLPADLELIAAHDQSAFISASIRQVTNAALLGGLLAVLVLYAFLRDARATFIIALSIPVSVIGTFALMHLSDLSLNIMSLGGIALAIGLLVDNSIVVLENIVRKREQGRSVLEAAREGTGEVATAVIAATLTTVAVFFPMVFVHGIAGQLFRDQALTVTYALLFSLILAIVLIPMLAAAGGRRGFGEAYEEAPAGRFTRAVAAFGRGGAKLLHGIGAALRLALAPLVWLVQRFNGAAARAYAVLLRRSLRHRLAVIGLAAAAFALTMLLVPRLGTELIPQLAQNEFSVSLRLPPGAPLDATDRAVQAAWRAAAAQPGVESTYSVAGTGNRLDASPVDAGENTGELHVVLAPGSDRETEARAIAGIRERLAGIAGLQYDFGRPELLALSTPLEVAVTGYELDRLAAAAERIARVLERSPRYTDLRTTVEGGNPEIQIAFDQDRAASLGLAVRDLADSVVRNVRGEVATRYSWRDTRIDVLVRSVDNRRATLEDITGLVINPASERPVSLDDVATIELADGPAEIRRIDQQRVALVSANLAHGDLGTATAEVKELIAAMPMPPGIAAEVRGQSEEMQASLASMQFTLLLAVFLVYLVMASQFESLIHPLVILFTIPLALVGAVLALYLSGSTLNVVAFIGIIMLAGIVVNNAIVLIDLVNQLRRAGAAVDEAILEAGAARLRPILMTTLTTALGLAPMAIGVGEGAEVRAPMAIAVIGGLLSSTLLTLVVIPVVYSLIERRRDRRRNRRRDRGHEGRRAGERAGRGGDKTADERAGSGPGLEEAPAAGS